MINIVKKASNSITNAITNVGGENLMKLGKVSPKILVIGGVTGLVVAGVHACVKTTRLEEVLDEASEKIQEVKDNNSEEEKDTKKDLAMVYLSTAGNIAKLYAIPVVTATVSVGMILGSNHILNKRNAAAMAAYALTSDEFKEYRQRVISELGIDADRRYRFGLVEEEITETIKDEKTGRNKKVKKKVEVIDPNNYSIYAKVFDDASKYWRNDPELNLFFLKTTQSLFNDLLRSRPNHTVFLNEVYEALDIPLTQEGQIVGWHLDGENSDGFIDFGMYNYKDETKRDFINCRESCIFLDFNVDGIVWDLI